MKSLKYTSVIEMSTYDKQSKTKSSKSRRNYMHRVRKKKWHALYMHAIHYYYSHFFTNFNVYSAGTYAQTISSNFDILNPFWSNHFSVFPDASKIEICVLFYASKIVSTVLTVFCIAQEMLLFQYYWYLHF